MNPGEGRYVMNPIGVDGIEYVEYGALAPQSFGAALERLGFAAVARHRSREIVLNPVGGTNVIVNADLSVAGSADESSQAPRHKAFALRVRDAAAAYSHRIDKGAVTSLGGTSFEFVKSHLGAGQ